MVECGALEKRCGCKVTEGSNPSLSAGKSALLQEARILFTAEFAEHAEIIFFSAHLARSAVKTDDL